MSLASALLWSGNGRKPNCNGFGSVCNGGVKNVGARERCTEIEEVKKPEAWMELCLRGAERAGLEWAVKGRGLLNKVEGSQHARVQASEQCRGRGQCRRETRAAGRTRGSRGAPGPRAVELLRAQQRMWVRMKELE